MIFVYSILKNAYILIRLLPQEELRELKGYRKKRDKQ